MPKLTFLEFFAGGGFARLALGRKWQCVLANDHDPKKARVYRDNWGKRSIEECDVAQVSLGQMSSPVDLVWASFPCQDVSQAGAGAGLRGKNSGTFWPFWQHMADLKEAGNAPRLIVLENVCGLVTSNQGRDLNSICRALSECDYRFGAMVIDAALFLPQSRKRMFMIAVHDGVEVPDHLISHSPKILHSDVLTRAHRNYLEVPAQRWIWWDPKPPSVKVPDLVDLLDPKPSWHAPEQTKELLNLMSSHTRQKLKSLAHSGARHTGTLYRRMRTDEQGKRVQRAEIRFDGLAGCLRAPTGGSSKQIVIEVSKATTRTRHLTGRESLRLMGVRDSYKVDAGEYDTYKIAGEGVAIPVVRYLSNNLLMPILRPGASA
ncbi:MAG: (cytosine-5)-methyltransferase 1 [Sphingomonadales bacterium]|jgi:DNA (cytosine-5)-methyltransferase 1|nr:(cytosine-5)-methyltransferase 1 [Sphingomonadales bacterium]